MSDEIFNAVAPIFIYHKADLHFKSEACAGLRWLKTNRSKARELIPEAELKVRSVDQLDPRPFWNAYNKLFEEIVAQITDAKPQIDDWGIRGYRLPSYFFGEAYGFYPLYLDASALRQRVRAG